MSELTVGEDLVGKSFNPSQDPKVAKLKALYAEIIDVLDEHAKGAEGDIVRHCKVAITEAQGAQMWAVKAVTRGL